MSQVATTRSASESVNRAGAAPPTCRPPSTRSATVLVFINQTTTSKENPDGSFAASAVKVGLKKINDTWLISSFDPV